MKKITILIVWLATTFAFAKDKYKYTVNLSRVVDDKVYVELEPPSIKEKEINFYLPKIIPGTYSIADYGRMVSGLKAYDKRGRSLEVERINDNEWKIKKSRKLDKISYWIEDTYDTQKEGPGIFQPAGTNIEAGANFIINPSGFFGYFEGMKELPFEITIIKPDGLYGATGLIPEVTGAELGSVIKAKDKEPVDSIKVDQFIVKDYDQLIDSPIMYSQPDTASLNVANTNVVIASYSPNDLVTAEQIAASIKEVLLAQKEYLGGKLPVDKYAFIFYFTDQPVMSYGALEHSYSSFYYMPEMPIDVMAQQLRDFAAHEFFHIITPLTIHSEEIENFDFNEPEMSKHLWLYEGVTEYFAGNVQVQYDLIGYEEYLNMLREKMIIASGFLDTVAFTDISQYTLDQYADQYYNVYQKGALIGFGLDVKLLKLSDQQYGLQELMADLSEKYGKNKPFDDDKLFEVITSMTYPEIGEFLNKHVGGTEPLPYGELFELVGVNYAPHMNIMTYTLGIGQEHITVAEYEGEQHLAIGDTTHMDPLGDSLNFHPGDILIGINQMDLPELSPELGEFIANVQQNLSEGDTLSYTVIRKNANNEPEEVELSTPVFMVEVPQLHVLELLANPSEEQMAMREAWLEPEE